MKWLKYPILLTILIIIIGLFQLHAQNPNQDRRIEKLPEYLGDSGDFFKYLSDNMIYPEVAKTIGYQGQVLVGFAINADGTVSDVKALNELGGGCDSEAVRLVKLSPKWKPAYINAQPIKVKISVPVVFTLDKSQINKTYAHLKKSPYGFLFFIGGVVYTVEEAEVKFGKTYDPDIISDVKKYNGDKHPMPDKQGVYLILMRNAF